MRNTKDGARITLEQDGYTPFSITCGIYGWMVHTRFFATRDEAEPEYERMKGALEKITKIVPYSNDPDIEMKRDRLAQRFRNSLCASVSRS